MREDLNARLEHTLQTYHQMRTDLAAAREAQAQATGKAENTDGLVQATVAPGGRIVELTIRERAMRRYNGAELAAEITGTITRATTRLNETILEQYRSVLGPQFDPTALSGDLGDLESLLRNTSQHLFSR